MDHTIALIQKSHEGDKAAREQCRADLVCGKAFLWTRT